MNQIYDIEGDRLNRKNLPLPLGLVSMKMAWIMTISSAVLALGVAFSLGIVTGVLTLFGLILGVLYSHPKWNLKSKPVPAILFNGLGHGSLVYLIGWSSVNLLRWESLYRMLPYAFAYGGVYLITTIPDIEGDRFVGKRTLAVVWGERRTQIIAFALIVLSTVAGYYMKERAVFLTGIFSAPFYAYSAIMRGRAYLRANAVAVLLLNFWIWWFFVIPYIPIMILVLIVARIYYKKRFGVNYV